MDEQRNIKTKDKDAQIPFEIPVEGSLGILALGAVGITEWRKVRNDHNKKIKSKVDNK